MAQPITFLSDYGEGDGFAGACRAAIAALAPEARVIDLAHGIPPGDVRRGALVLEAALPFAPPGIHLAVVDPGVGGDRRAVAVQAHTEDRVLVGPDNGLLAPALARLGGAAEAVELSASPLRREPVAPTFHGRDIFAPVAARLATGTPLAEAGEPLDPAVLVPLELPEPEIAAGRLTAHVLYADRFGNLILDATPDTLAQAGLEHAATLTIATPTGRTLQARRAPTFSAVPEKSLLLYQDSSGRLALALNRANAAATLPATPNDPLTIEAAR